MIQKKTRLPMNLPNRLTLLRIAMIPLYLVLLTGSVGCRIGAERDFRHWQAAVPQRGAQGHRIVCIFHPNNGHQAGQRQLL